MTRKFKNIKYYLSCDIIVNNNELESLKIHSLNLRIGKIIKNIFQSDWGRSLLRNKNSNIYLYEDFFEVENIVQEQLEFECEQLTLAPSLRKAKAHFMIMHILSFLSKYPYFHIEFPEYLFPYVVFTSQGTINTIKSIKLLWNAYPKKVFRYFQLRCYLFFEDDVKLHFEHLPLYVKKNLVSNMKKDFFMNFCIREAKIDHQFIREAFDGYPRDEYYVTYKGTFFKAIEFDNEIAVEYLWRNRISKMTGGGRDILCKALIWIVGKPLKINILMFLLFQVNENEFEDFFRLFSFKVMENVVKEVRWHCVFNKIFDVLKFYITSESVSKIFENLIDPHCKDCPAGINLDLVVNYFSSLSESNKIYIMRNYKPKTNNLYSYSIQEDKNPYKNVLWKIITSDREDYLEKMLRVEDCTEVKNFFISQPGVDILSEAFKNGKIHLIYKVLQKVLNKKVLNVIDCYLWNISRYLL